MYAPKKLKLLTSLSYRKNTLSLDRAISDPIIADKSNFLHPVFYYYEDNDHISMHWVLAYNASHSILNDLKSDYYWIIT